MSDSLIPAHLKLTLKRLATVDCKSCAGTGIAIQAKSPTGYKEIRCGCCDRQQERSGGA